MNLSDTYDSRKHTHITTARRHETAGNFTFKYASRTKTRPKLPPAGAILGTYPKRLVLDHSQSFAAVDAQSMEGHQKVAFEGRHQICFFDELCLAVLVANIQFLDSDNLALVFSL